MVKFRKRLWRIGILLFLFLVLSLPDSIKDATCLYKMTTSDLSITYTYNYYFSYIEIPIIFLGLFQYKRSKVVRFGKVYFAILLINVSFFLLGMPNVFELNSYEMFLLLLTGFSAASITMFICRTDAELEQVLDWFVNLQFGLVVLNILLNANKLGGRYSAIAMGSGATASIATGYLIWTFFARKGKVWYIPVFFAVATILLTGSRANLIAFLMVTVLFSARLYKKQIRQGNGNKVMAILLICIPAMLLFLLLLYLNGRANIFTRITDLLRGDIINNIITDSSYLGRIRSIEGCFNILKDNPVGLPFSIYAIEKTSAYTFNMEYPHSTLLSYILLWTPVVAILILLFLLIMFVKLVKQKNTAAIYIGYYIFMAVVYGAPILYAKTYAFDLIIVSYIYNQIAKEKIKKLKTGGN